MLKTGISEEQEQLFTSVAEMASNHMQNKRYEEALSVSLKAMELGEKIYDLNTEHWTNNWDEDVHKLVRMYSLATNSCRQLGDNEKFTHYADKCVGTNLTIAKSFESRGQFHIASAYYFRARVYCQAFLGKECETNARIRLYSGRVKYYMANYREAKEELLAAQKISEVLFGKNHPLSIEIKCMLKVVEKVKR